MARREFTEKVKREIRARSGGYCECHMMPSFMRELFPVKCTRKAGDIDHIYPDGLEDEEAKLEPLTAEEGAHLSDVCHPIKTTHDRKAMARRNGHAVNRNRPKKNKTPKTVTRPKRKSQWGNPNLKRTVGGKVVRREK